MPPIKTIADLRQAAKDTWSPEARKAAAEARGSGQSETTKKINSSVKKVSGGYEGVVNGRKVFVPSDDESPEGLSKAAKAIDEWSPEAREAAAEARRKGAGSKTGYGPNGENLNKSPKEKEAERLKRQAKQAQQGVNERFNNKPYKY